jgi:cell wall hydrolase
VNATPLPTPERPIAAQPPETLLAICVFGEARGESPQARRAVAQVVLNRALHPHQVFGSQAGAPLEDNLRRVILQPRQFSCFLESDPNHAKLLRPLDYERPEVWQRCVDTAREALAQAGVPDALTLNSDHYFDESLQPPTWADPSHETVQIGRLRFFRIYLPLPTAGAGFLMRTGSADRTWPIPPAAESASPQPSLRESLPPGISCRAVAKLRCASNGAHLARHRREVFGSGSPVSYPALHLPSQRTPRLADPRWYQRSRELSSLRAAGALAMPRLAMRDSGIGRKTKWWSGIAGIAIAMRLGFRGWTLGIEK